MIPQGGTRTFVGVLVGVIILSLVTALLASAVYSFSTSGHVSALSKDLVDANNQLDDLRASDADSQKRSAQAKRERADLLAQNRNLQRQVTALVRYLRQHDIGAPPAAATVPAPALPRPASPKHREQVPTRHPSKPPKPAPKPNSICALVPLLCPSLRLPKVVLP